MDDDRRIEAWQEDDGVQVHLQDEPYHGVCMRLTIEEARELAARLLEVVDELENSAS